MLVLNLLNRIFGKRPTLKRSDIDRYQRDASDKQAIEEQSASNSFDADALDGFSENQLSTSSMKDLDNRIKQKYSNSNSNFAIKTIWVVFIMSSILLLYINYEKQAEPIGDKTNELDSDKHKKQVEEVEQHSTNSVASNIIQPEYKIKPSSLQRKKVEEELFIHETERNEIKNEEVKQQDNTPLYLPINAPERLPSNTTIKLKYKLVKEIYLHDFKLVDYRAYRNRPIKKQLVLDVGTPASQESKTYEESIEEEIVEVPYIDFIETSMKLFEQEDYTKALQRFKLILKIYPDDVNANFYGGLCYYNLGYYEKARTLFQQSYSLTFGNFYEESKWFEALTLLALQEIHKATIHLQKIINEDGFYANQAKQKLEELK